MSGSRDGFLHARAKKKAADDFIDGLWFSLLRSSLLRNKISGAPGEIRTPDHQVRSLVLYPAELRARRTRIMTESARHRQIEAGQIKTGGERGIRTLDGS
jgi:hypothetical protein